MKQLTDRFDLKGQAARNADLHYKLDKEFYLDALYQQYVEKRKMHHLTLRAMELFSKYEAAKTRETLVNDVENSRVADMVGYQIEDAMEAGICNDSEAVY